MEETNEPLQQILEWALQWLKETGEFATEQAPLVIQEFYMWSTASHIFWIGFGILLIITSIWFNKLGREHGTFEGHDNPLCVLVWIPCIFGILSILNNVYNLIYILVAPRMYLIEEIAGWLK